MFIEYAQEKKLTIHLEEVTSKYETFVYDNVKGDQFRL